MLKKLAHRCFEFLSTRIATLIAICAVIISRCIQLLFFSYLGGDRAHQALAAQNFLFGHGISISKVLPGDLSTIIYEPLIKWPPGYSYLLAPFYAIFQHNHIAAGFTLDILFAILLIFACRGILKLLDLPTAIINLFTLLTGFIIYSFYKQPYADAIGITAFVSAVWMTLSIIKVPVLWKSRMSLIILFLIVCSFSKYLYMPVVFVIPAYLIVTGWKNKQLQLKKAGWIMLIILSLFTMGLLLYQQSVSGAAIYITEPTRGIFPENLLSAYPSLPAAFINPETIGMFLNRSALPGSFVYIVFQLVHILLVALLIVIGFRKIFSKGLKQLSLRETYFHISLFTLLAVTGVLSLLSLRVAKELDIWTYIQEARYYGLIIIMTQLSIFAYYKTAVTTSINKLKRWFFLLPLLLLPEMFRGIIFTTNRILHIKTEEYTWQTEYKLQDYADGLIKQLIKNNTTENIVLTGSADYINNRIALNSNLPMLDNSGLINNQPLLQTKSKVVLFVVLNEKLLDNYKLFTHNGLSKYLGQYKEFYFYSSTILPQQNQTMQN